MVELICHFARHIHYHHFRVEELEALSEFNGWPAANLWTAEPRPDSQSDAILVRVVLPSVEVAEAIAKRALLIRSFIEPWGDGVTLEDCVESMKDHDPAIRRERISDTKSFCFQIETYGKHVSQEEKLTRMEAFRSRFVGDEKVDCSNPDTTLMVVEEFGHVIQQESGLPRRCVCGPRVAQGRPDKNGWWTKYNLPQRPVLGPTTLDHELAFLMCNQAHVRAGSLVLDPYYGTGSIMVSATHLGAFPLGTEIDMRVLQGWGIAYLNKGLKHKPNARKSYRANFEHYGLPLPEVIRADNAAAPWKLPMQSEAESAQRLHEEETGLVSRRLRIPGYDHVRPWVDAIVSDPPYGIRAGTRQGGHGQSNKKVVTDAEGNAMSGSHGAWREAKRKQREAKGLRTKKERLADKERDRELWKQRREQGALPGQEGFVPTTHKEVAEDEKRRKQQQDGEEVVEEKTVPVHEAESPSTADERAEEGVDAQEEEGDASPKMTLEEIEEEVRQARANRLLEAQATALDLMDLAARVLVDNGRLVFLLPVDLNAEKDQAVTFARQAVDLRKEQLELVGPSREPLAGGMGRYMVTMRRLPRPQTDDMEEPCGRRGLLSCCF